VTTLLLTVPPMTLPLMLVPMTRRRRRQPT
jgi:hypothetical protein